MKFKVGDRVVANKELLKEFGTTSPESQLPVDTVAVVTQVDRTQDIGYPISVRWEYNGVPCNNGYDVLHLNMHKFSTKDCETALNELKQSMI